MTRIIGLGVTKKPTKVAQYFEPHHKKTIPHDMFEQRMLRSAYISAVKRCHHSLIGEILLETWSGLRLHCSYSGTLNKREYLMIIFLISHRNHTL